ncbi:hypothetical protein C1645_733438 [Glomus cerebriforme]|uniref:Uncharacterized protein n=1 Tax=Glomus cerebriforme TaxID=658196 RepID=A0A397TDE4_9GLOM|nr:hypothetical protein C1645_733438 [Glomus cerebriforme]
MGIEVGNLSKIKHYVVLLKNNMHICSCLMAVQKIIICRYYFQFCNSISINVIQEIGVGYLYVIDKEKKDFLNWHMNFLDEKLMYSTLYGTYKRALQKALQLKSKLLCLIGILKNFANNDSESESESEESDEVYKSDKDNANVFQLQNPKIKHDKGRLVGTYKVSDEKNQSEKIK